MRVIIKDNGKTNCRELFYDDEIQIAVNVKNLDDHLSYGHADSFALILSFAPWEPGKIHMDSERYNELV